MPNPLLILCFLVVYFREEAGRPWLWDALGPWGAAASSLALMAAIALGAHALVASCGRRLARTGRSRSVLHADWILMGSRLAAAAAHVVIIVGFGWLDAIRAAIGDPVGLDEAIAVVPVLAVFVAGYWSFYPIEKRVREAVLLRNLDAGRPIYEFPGRARYTFVTARHRLAIVVVPFVLIIAWGEAVEWGAMEWARGRWGGWGWGGQTPGEWALLAVVAIQAAGTLAVFALMPPIVRHVWDTERLGEGELRSSLLALCRQYGVRLRELLVWRTWGTMGNGVVMGLAAPVRYVMLTDLLLDTLPPQQLEAVMAHEVGHVKRRHLTWLVLTLIAAMAGTLTLVQLASWIVPIPGWLIAGSAWPLTLAAIGAAMFVSGFVSRRFEWQADAFAVQHLSRAGAVPGMPPVILPQAAATMSAALSTVASLNHVPRRRFSWRHGSIATRQVRLLRLVGHPLDRLPIDREATALKLAVLAVLAASIGVMVWEVAAR